MWWRALSQHTVKWSVEMLDTKFVCQDTPHRTKPRSYDKDGTACDVPRRKKPCIINGQQDCQRCVVWGGGVAHLHELITMVITSVAWQMLDDNSCEVVS